MSLYRYCKIIITSSHFKTMRNFVMFLIRDNRSWNGSRRPSGAGVLVKTFLGILFNIFHKIYIYFEFTAVKVQALS